MHVVDTTIRDGRVPIDTMQGVHRAETEHVIVEIAEEIAAATGTAPHDLDTPLYEVVDTDSLEELAASDALVRVSFSYEGHVVEVDGDGTVSVEAHASGAEHR